MEKVTKQEIVALAMMLAMAIEKRITLATWIAEWEDGSEEVPDMQLGTGNNWWLRCNEETGLYIQHRERKLTSYTWEIACRMRTLIKEYEELSGRTIKLPWTDEELEAPLKVGMGDIQESPWDRQVNHTDMH